MTPEQLLAFVATDTSERAESGLDFRARVAAFRAELPTKGGVVVFTHFGVVRELLGSILGFRRAPQEIANASVFRLAIDERSAEVEAWNVTDHLCGIDG